MGIGMYTDQQARLAAAFSVLATTTSVQCGCGVTHFTTAIGHGDYDRGELERLQELAKKSPHLCREDSEFDTFDLVGVNGKEYVVGCRCGRAESFAAALESDADRIAAYLLAFLRDRGKEQERRARASTEAAANLESALAAAR